MAAAGYVVADDTLKKLLARMRGTATDWTGYHIHLFQNEYTPADGTTLADLTEADFMGYADQAIDFSLWSAPAMVGHVANITAPTHIDFDSDPAGADQTIYGYYVTDAADALAWAESWAAGVVVAAGGELQVTPSFKDKTCRS